MLQLKRLDPIAFSMETRSDEEDDRRPDDAEDEVEQSWTAEELAEVSYLDDAGYVHCPIAPYDSMNWRQIGRITDWPDTKPVPQRSVSCSCFLHSGCKSPAIKRHLTTDTKLLTWLFGAVIEDKCSRPRLVELRAGHKAAFPAAML